MVMSMRSSTVACGLTTSLPTQTYLNRSCGPSTVCCPYLKIESEFSDSSITIKMRYLCHLISSINENLMMITHRDRQRETVTEIQTQRDRHRETDAERQTQRYMPILF